MVSAVREKVIVLTSLQSKVLPLVKRSFSPNRILHIRTSADLSDAGILEDTVNYLTKREFSRNIDDDKAVPPFK